jgi:NTE family protein
MPAETATAVPTASVPPSGDPRRGIAIACQGGGSHTAFTAGVLAGLLADDEFWIHHRLVGLSGTSGGAVCASLAWSGLHSGEIQVGANQQPVFTSDSKAARDEAAHRVMGFWSDLGSVWNPDQLLNQWSLWLSRLPVVSDYVPAAVSAYTRGRMEEQIGRYFIPPQHVTKDLLPRLYVGAVDICEGKRRIFRDGEVDVEAIIASAAVPPLYEPVLKKTGDRESWYWDGLFATNPPVSELVRGNEDIDYADKPDVLLVIRINPTRKPTPPVLFRDKVDRRNELAGNLALSRELDAIEAINAILEKTSRDSVRVDVERHDGPNVERVFKPVIVREVELDEAVGKFGGGRHLDLDLASKFSIAPGFIEALVDVGLGQATQASLDLVAEKLKGDDGVAVGQMRGQA